MAERAPGAQTPARLRVVMLRGSFAPENDHLALLGRHIDFTLYGSEHRVTRKMSEMSEARPPEEVPTRSFKPVWPTERGHILWLYRGLGDALDVDQPDLIHVISEPWGMLVTQALRWASKTRTPLIIHGCDRVWWHGSRPERVAKRRLARRNLRRAHGFVGESEKSIELARATGLRQESPTAVIHTNPRNPEVFRPPAHVTEKKAARRQLGLPVEGIGFGFLSYLSSEKGPLLFVDGFRAARDLLPSGSWGCVAGGGPIENDVSASCARSQISFLGRLRFPSEVALFYQSLDVFVFTPRRTGETEEQGPRTIIESMMSGCIVIGSDSGAIPEMIGRMGIVVPERDEGALKQALARAPDMCSAVDLRTRSRAAAISRYSTSAVADAMSEFYRAALSSCPERPAQVPTS